MKQNGKQAEKLARAHHTSYYPSLYSNWCLPRTHLLNSQLQHSQDEAERQADEQAEKLARARRASGRAAQALGLPPPGAAPPSEGVPPLAKEATLAEMREVGGV